MKSVQTQRSVSAATRRSSRHSAQRAWNDPDDEPPSQLALGALASPATEVRESATIDELRELFVDRRVAALAVVDETRALCGIVTRTDVLRMIDRPTTTAGEAMSRFVFALPASAAIGRAAALMAYEYVGVIVVTDDGDGVLGMVSAVDITRHLAIERGFLVE